MLQSRFVGRCGVALGAGFDLLSNRSQARQLLLARERFAAAAFIAGVGTCAAGRGRVQACFGFDGFFELLHFELAQTGQLITLRIALEFLAL